MLSLGLDPGYVLDRMEMFEIRALLEHRHLRHKESWEQSRLTAFINARCSGAKIEKMEDLFALPWDKEKEKGNEDSDYSQLERLKAKAKAIEDSGFLMMKNGSGV